MTLAVEFDLDNVKMNQSAEWRGQRSFRSKVIVRRQTHTDTTDQLLDLDYKMVVGKDFLRLWVRRLIQKYIYLTHKADYSHLQCKSQQNNTKAK